MSHDLKFIICVYIGLCHVCVQVLGEVEESIRWHWVGIRGGFKHWAVCSITVKFSGDVKGIGIFLEATRIMDWENRIGFNLFRRVSVIILEHRAENTNLEIEGKKDVKEKRLCHIQWVCWWCYRFYEEHVLAQSGHLILL